MLRTCLAATAAALAPALLLATTALAHAPGVEITAPSADAVVYVEAFPAVVPIVAIIRHGQNDPAGGAVGASLSDLQSLGVTVDEVDVPTTAGNPFPGNACSATQLTPANGWAACLTNSTTQATVWASWTVGEPGQYAIAVRVRHPGAGGGLTSEEEDVDVVLLSVEHPAPPAVANAYLRDHYRKVTGGCRGHVISKIANHHAMDSKYGQKGGPYDIAAINSDVRLYMGGC
jgi:hypothetical protein